MRYDRSTPFGIKLVTTVLLCSLLLFIALFFFFDDKISGDGTLVNSSSSSTQSPSEDSSEDNDNSSGNKPSGDIPGGDTPGGDTPGGDTPGGDTPGGDHLIGKASLKRVKLTGTRLQGGSMVEFTNETQIDFSNPTDENLFGISKNETVVPGCKYEATMTLSNEGDFALDYWMEVRMTSGFDTALAEQLKVTLTVNGVDYTTSVGNPLGDMRAPIGQIAKGERITFTISVEFIEHENNNAAQGQTVVFDLYVTTTQAS